VTADEAQKADHGGPLDYYRRPGRENPSADPIEPGAEEVAGKSVHCVWFAKMGLLLRRLAAPNSGLSYCGRVGRRLGIERQCPRAGAD
jgi:hypothetical protein